MLYHITLHLYICSTTILLIKSAYWITRKSNMCVKKKIYIHYIENDIFQELIKNVITSYFHDYKFIMKFKVLTLLFCFLPTLSGLLDHDVENNVARCLVSRKHSVQ